MQNEYFHAPRISRSLIEGNSYSAYTWASGIWEEKGSMKLGFQPQKNPDSFFLLEISCLGLLGQDANGRQNVRDTTTV